MSKKTADPKRNTSRVVIAEDDRETRNSWAQILSSFNGFECTVVSHVRDTDCSEGVITALRKSQAFWALLDLELLDANVVDILPEIRQEFGEDVYIMIITGNADRYQEASLYSKGVDFVFRKPIDPRAVSQQISTAAQSMFGNRPKPIDGILLEITSDNNIFVVDPGSGSYRSREGDRGTLDQTSTAVLKVMASHRSDHGWEKVPRSELVVALSRDIDEENLSRISDQVRQIGQNIRKALHKTTFWVVDRDHNHTTSFRFSDNVSILDEWPDWS